MPGKDDEDWWRFLKLCTAAENPERLNEVFELFLTIEERRDLKKRFQIVEGLLKGNKSQRELAAELRVSISKITRGSNSLKIIDRDLKKFCRRAME